MHVESAELAESGRGAGEPALPLTVRLFPHRLALVVVPVATAFLLFVGAYAADLSVLWVGLVAVLVVPTLVTGLLLWDRFVRP